VRVTGGVQPVIFLRVPQERDDAMYQGSVCRDGRMLGRVRMESRKGVHTIARETSFLATSNLGMRGCRSLAVFRVAKARLSVNAVDPQGTRRQHQTTRAFKDSEPGALRSIVPPKSAIMHGQYRQFTFASRRMYSSDYLTRLPNKQF
jgi:hypothetical protein